MKNYHIFYSYRMYQCYCVNKLSASYVNSYNNLLKVMFHEFSDIGIMCIL